MSIGAAIARLEKAHYPFRRYPKKRCETILFPGCSFPSQFPRAMDRLADICSQNGIGIAYDCCGVSLSSHKDGSEATRVIEGIRKRLAALGCKRLVCMCPFCYYYLRDQLDVELLSTYQLLAELGVRQEAVFEEGALFIPCPDRKSRTLEGQIRESFDLGGIETLAKGCCGLRPDIYEKGPEKSRKCGLAAASHAKGKTIYTCCASCAGQFQRLGVGNVRNILPAILGVDEQPDSAHAFMNRAKRKFDKRTDPAGR